MRKHLRRLVFETLEARPQDSILGRALQLCVMALICLNVAAVILESVPSICRQAGTGFHWFEVFSVLIFTVEYLLRLWSCTEDARWKRPILGRIRYALSAMSVVDLLAILPFYLPMLIPIDLRFVRALRLLRVFRVLKMGRHSKSLQMLARAFTAKKDELAMTVFVVAILLILASSMIYFAERDCQSDRFGSIPQSMWWAVATLTTVGYGDVCPTTPLGKLIAAVVAILGVALFAMPTAILATGFMEQLQQPKGNPEVCPHCGKTIE